MLILFFSNLLSAGLLSLIFLDIVLVNLCHLTSLQGVTRGYKVRRINTLEYELMISFQRPDRKAGRYSKPYMKFLKQPKCGCYKGRFNTCRAQLCTHDDSPLATSILYACSQRFAGHVQQGFRDFPRCILCSFFSLPLSF